MVRTLFSLFWCLTSLFVFAQNTESNEDFHLYLIGDAGEPYLDQIGYRKYLQDKLTNESVPSAIVFLGDNIYPKGLPEMGTTGRAQAEQIIKNQIELVKGVKGPVYFIPGNHDWKKGRKDGIEFIQRQQRWIDSLNIPNVQFLPKGGCPGPIEIELSKQLTLVILDTQWLLHPWDKPVGETSLCDAKSGREVMIQLEDILRRNRGKRVVITGHHPIYTYGEHGGVFTLKNHLFPLTDISKNLYLPLPIIGSIYPLYRKVFGNIQDTSNPTYKQFITTLTTLLKQYPGTIYAAGHEHTLQYSWADSIHYVVSGAGVKAQPVRQKGFAEYATSRVGFVELRVTKNGAGQLEYVSDDKILFTKVLAVPSPPILPIPDKLIREDSVVARASVRYTGSEKHDKWFGANYRKEWNQDIKVKVFDIDEEKGGLKIIQRGGGQQTLSLRLEDSLGREFTLRSIEKFPEKAVPLPFRKTFVEDLVQDQISAAHPYGATVVPSLAQAAGIYHTNPIVVYVPNDPRFGIYQKDFANQLMLFEERPSGTGKGMEFFGDADKIISTDKLLEKLASDNDNKVDEEFVLRSRLFDLWIGDWDRHDDQWRWAEFDGKKGKTYRPIPRDRDQAFFVNQGRIPRLWSKPYLLPKFEGFSDKVQWPSGLMFNGRYFDRSFLNGLTLEQWRKTSDDLVAKMTDEVIEAAIRQWPADIYKLHGAEIIRKLKARRSLLTGYALEHYLFLAKAVDVVGSNKNELFEIENHADGNLTIHVFKWNKEGEKGKKLFERLFKQEETSEVRLYGLGGDDHFEVKGSGSKIEVRVIGGEGSDLVNTTEKGGKLLVYDTEQGAVTQGTHFVDRRSSDPKVNEYNRKAFVYDRSAPLVFGNYSVDDGLFVGGGFLITTNKFRKTPAQRHLFLGSVALNTGSFNFRYDGRFMNAVGKWNFEIDADIKSPNYVNNFFGWGNESVFDKSINDKPGIDVDNAIHYYRVRFREYALELKLARTFGQTGFFKFGTTFQHISIDKPNGDRYINEYVAATNPTLFEDGRNFAGITYTWGFDKRNHPVITTRGVYFQQTSRWMKGVGSNSSDFASHKVSLALYQSFKFPAKVTFAFRAGGGLNEGTYEFYNGQILDGKTEVRGFRKTRFYGDSKVYFNNEVRIKLATFQSYLFPASLGVHGFYDVGRVWYKDSTGKDPSSPDGSSNVWHKGFGGGVWFTPYDLAVLTTEIGHSVEGTLFYIRLGFLF